MGNASLYPSRHLGTPRLIAPNAAFAPYEVVHGIRRFLLTAEVIAHELVRGVVIQAWGYNGSIPGPVIVTHEGERIQVALHNRLPEPTAIHWHGLNVPNQVDGVPEIGAGPLVLPGQTYVYDFAVPQSGTFMYHAHAHDAKQEMMGLGGMFISLPRHLQTADREFIILLQEWSVRDQAATAPATAGHPDPSISAASVQPRVVTSIRTIDPMSMDFNYFTMNGKSYPDTEPLLVRYGERVRIRLGNLSMDSHPMHLHGHTFHVVAGDGWPLPVRVLKNTMNVAPAPNSPFVHPLWTSSSAKGGQTPPSPFDTQDFPSDPRPVAQVTERLATRAYRITPSTCTDPALPRVFR
ncbi:multicopper oxidase family protein [Kyrpidia spormannii]|uniref:Copper oxidase n=1 Tax=Kyrpidia spormannii TaxID=2055160 RepID=A0ACA8Z5E0_9BACL|nr:multicopper oxidase domain-containing protein [Kyrpidia spormannii]CAB3389526.1 Copper oxidase [Kyrpidia spormannii]